MAAKRRKNKPRMDTNRNHECTRISTNPTPSLPPSSLVPGTMADKAARRAADRRRWARAGGKVIGDLWKSGNDRKRGKRATRMSYWFFSAHTADVPHARAEKVPSTFLFVIQLVLAYLLSRYVA